MELSYEEDENICLMENDEEDDRGVYGCESIREPADPN